MIKRLIDVASERTFRAVPRSLSMFSVLPVLHVERLHQDLVFKRTMEFCRDYLDLSGHKVVATVIPPISPVLADMLARASFSEELYQDRLVQLAEVSEIGLHGHYMRDVESVALVHNYWNERAIVTDQMASEIEWLESRELMTTRIYSGGWWYCDRVIADALSNFEFKFDFSFSTTHFNIGPLSHNGVRRSDISLRQRRPSGKPDPLRVWAVSDICSSGRCFAFPRHLLSAFSKSWLARRQTVVSLYGHDYDMDPGAARAMLSQLSAIGVGLAGLETISNLVLSERKVAFAECP